MANKFYKYKIDDHVTINKIASTGMPHRIGEIGKVKEQIDSLTYDYLVEFKDGEKGKFKEAELYKVYIPNMKIENGVITEDKEDIVNKPNHYTYGGIEPLDYMKAKLSKIAFEGFLTGNVIKYISRSEKKNGLEDLKKAQFYLNKLINERESVK